MGSDDRRICLRSGAPSAVCGRRHRKTRTHPNPLPLVRGAVDAAQLRFLRVASKEKSEPAAGRTPDPSTSLRSGRDDNGRGVAKFRVVTGWEETADPSATLRFGRDDKGRAVAKVRIVAGWGETAGPSIPLATPTLATALPLSSRPERSVVEGSAVRPAALSISPGSALSHPPQQLRPADSARTLPVALRCRLQCAAV